LAKRSERQPASVTTFYFLGSFFYFVFIFIFLLLDLFAAFACHTYVSIIGHEEWVHYISFKKASILV